MGIVRKIIGIIYDGISVAVSAGAAAVATDVVVKHAPTDAESKLLLGTATATGTTIVTWSITRWIKKTVGSFTLVKKVEHREI